MPHPTDALPSTAEPPETSSRPGRVKLSGTTMSTLAPGAVAVPIDAECPRDSQPLTLGQRPKRS